MPPITRKKRLNIPKKRLVPSNYGGNLNEAKQADRERGQPASHDHDGRDYLHWHVAPVLASCRCSGLHAFATAVLANSFRYPALLRYPYSNRENVADAQVVAINCGSLNAPEATVDAVFRLCYTRKQL